MHMTFNKTFFYVSHGIQIEVKENVCLDYGKGTTTLRYW